ncbi:aliphatic sulfonate ABC transporter substrate-binding protein [Salarchaeum sp. III]|uniref:aliphatic sulfonate ABC transporter substrate-binding protein n=1 Tax=Salarchaeum sp. III TaxID=3107927 RepID=UPI002ED8A0B4
MDRRTFLGSTGAAAASLTAGCIGSGIVGGSRTVTLDYAYYNPVSLVLREKGWVEAEFEDSDASVEWVLSLGSNKANQYSQSGEAQAASTAGIAALMARANGVPIRTGYIYSRPEWTALVAESDSGISEVADLEGKSVAATLGTDPHFFLLQALDTAGLSENDVDIVDLQHPEGQDALLQGEVDAWAGLDPHMAELQLEHDVDLFFRRPEFNTNGTLNLLEGFLENHPEDVNRVLRAYERGRKWAIENPEETVSILANASEMSEPVARKVFTDRTDLSEPIPGDQHQSLLSDLAPILQEKGFVDSSVDLQAAIDELVRPSIAESVVNE